MFLLMNFLPGGGAFWHTQNALADQDRGWMDLYLIYNQSGVLGGIHHSALFRLAPLGAILDSTDLSSCRISPLPGKCLQLSSTVVMLRLPSSADVYYEDYLRKRLEYSAFLPLYADHLCNQNSRRNCLCSYLLY